MSDLNTTHPNIERLTKLAPHLIPLLNKIDAGAQLMAVLPTEFPPPHVVSPGGFEAWEQASLYLLNTQRTHEALDLFWALYLQMIKGQETTNRIHKGNPLVWMSECYFRLGFLAHSKRYLMLTLCEDAITEHGVIHPENTGVYFRLVWRHGFADKDVQQYAKKIFDLSKRRGIERKFPEAVLLQLNDDSWLTEFPSPSEAITYRVNPSYVQYLLAKLGKSNWKALESLAGYLMSCIPGCRVKFNQRSKSTEYDIVCALEGPDVDFRSELGRYFICECKNWTSPADFAAVARFIRVVESTKSKFGILFSRKGITGDRQTKDAARELLKVFQSHGIAVVVLDQSHLEQVASGTNFITILRAEYEKVRLDLPKAN